MVVAFNPLADTLTSALRTLVLGGVLAALAGLPAAAIARLRRGGSPAWLASLAGPALTLHALNLVFCLFLLVWMVVASLGSAQLPGPGQLAIFIASFLIPNGAGLLAWRYVRQRGPCDDPPHVVPREGGL